MQQKLSLFVIIAGLLTLSGCLTTLDMGMSSVPDGSVVVEANGVDGVGELDVAVTVDGYPYWTGAEYVYVNPYHYYYRSGGAIYLYDYGVSGVVVVDQVPGGFYVLDREVHIPQHYYRHPRDYYHSGPSVHREFRHDGYRPDHRGGGGGGSGHVQNRPHQGNGVDRPMHPRMQGKQGPTNRPQVGDRSGRPTQPRMQQNPQVRPRQPRMQQNPQVRQQPRIQPKAQPRMQPKVGSQARPTQPRMQPRQNSRPTQPRMQQNQQVRQQPRMQPKAQMPRQQPRMQQRPVQRAPQPRMQAPRPQQQRRR